MYGELAVCVVGIYVCFLTWQLTQESVTTQVYGGQKFKYFVVLSIVQSLSASLVGYIYLRLRGKQLDTLKPGLLQGYLKLAVIGTISPQFGYAALKHIDYPTVILGKSCKLVPLMLMNFLIYRRTFPWYKYLVVGVITAGVSSFMLLHEQEGKGSGTKTNSLYGLALLMISLLMDGTMNSTQDQIFRIFRVSGSSMMVTLNLVSSVLMAGYLLLWPYTHELANAVAFCTAHPRIVYDILLYGFCGAIGQCFIFHTLERFGAVSLVTVNVTRKMFSILLSLFWFDHHLTIGQWISVGVVFLGITLETYLKGGDSKGKVLKTTVVENSLKRPASPEGTGAANLNINGVDGVRHRKAAKET
ncbi:UAA transporter [Gaertneriomyces semiglobifer]|nr:UAA transporter [Gaertneriomyces semiglobifer]